MKKALIGVSGGPDSIFLLTKILSEKEFIPVVVHVNFKQRKTSDNDQKFVEDFCRENKIQIFVKKVMKDDWKRAPIRNFEAAARWIRYEYFYEISKLENIDTLLIGHHLDDWLETAIMLEDKSDNYLYYGIKYKSNYKNLNILRPLIKQKLFKSEIIKQLKENNIPYCIDETNELEIYTRNKIRANLLMKSEKQKLNLIKYYSKINKSKQKLASKLEKIFNEWKKTKFTWIYFNSVPQKFKKELIYYYFSKSNIFINLNKNKLEAVIKFLESSAENRNFRLMETISLTIQNGSVKLIYEEN